MGIDVTDKSATRMQVDGGRRRFMRRVGEGAAMVAGLQMLAACKDDVVGAESVPTVPIAAASPPPAYTASDTDRLNFALQLHYLLAAYLQAGVEGTTLAPALTAGSGTAGAVRGGARVTFGDPVLTAQMREVAENTVAHLTLLRRLAGNAVTAQPTIDISGGAGSPFEAIARNPRATPSPTPTPAPAAFDPYASETNFLLGAVALSSVVSTAMADTPRKLSAPLAAQITAMVSASGARDGVVRAALYKAAFAEDLLPEEERGDPTIYRLSYIFSDTRNSYDGAGNLDRGIGAPFYPDILAEDPDRNALRRTPEQALGVLYASAASVASGGFFPAGVNGAIRNSGANTLS